MKNDNGINVIIRPKALRDLMNRDGYTNKTLAAKLNVSESAVKKWTTGRNNPSDYSIILDLAAVFQVAPEDLVEEVPESISVEELKEVEISKTEVMTWAQIRKALRERLLLRAYLEDVVKIIYGINLTFIDKFRIIYLKKDGTEELRSALSTFLRKLNNEPTKKWHEKGNWLLGINQKRMIRRDVRFVGVDMGFMLAYLRYVEQYQMNITDIINLFVGGANIGYDFLAKMYDILNWYHNDMLEHTLPVENEESYNDFKAYSMTHTINSKSTVIPLFITPYGENRITRTKALYDFINANGLTTFATAKYFADDNLQTIISEVGRRSNYVLLMYDNRYGDDEVLKRRVEAYAAENNIRICYLNPVHALKEA